jgi:hypothetical protein
MGRNQKQPRNRYEGVEIHDHFDGSAHCVECGGECRLTGSNLAVTSLVSDIMDHTERAGRGWYGSAQYILKQLLGERFESMRERARETGKL